MIPLLSYLKWMSLVFPAVHAQGFTFPTEQMTFVAGDLVNITWNVPAARFSLYEICSISIPLQCTYPQTAPVCLIYKTNSALLRTANSTNTFNYIWNATRDHYRESGCVFELELLYGDGSWLAPNFTSPFFAVDMRYAGDPAPTDWNFGGSSSTSAISTPTPTPTSSPTSTSTLSSTTSSAPASATTSASPQSGLTSAQKVGIGVGVSLGVLLLGLLGFLLLYYKRRQANSNKGMMEQVDPTQTEIKPPTTSTNHHMSGTETLFSELSSENYDGDGRYRDSSVQQRPISELMGSPAPRAELE